MIQPRTYAGIGARATPKKIQENMTMAATQLSEHGLVLRSGGAEGADSAFERGAEPDKKEIFLPWQSYNGNKSLLYTPLWEAYNIAEYYHPNWSACTSGVRALMARNSHQILGASLNDPVLFVLCWTPNGAGGGGTGQAIRLAEDQNIPVFDMGSMPLEEIADRINPFIMEGADHG